ncbi:acetolactate synthase large subunit [Paracoccus suum]|uniref:Acetolactate synthase large subunit n=1 Tax=Paracoccus suum TaxID=2259340 RepID=A0A344PLE0_9RHOB|nr:acetolactate synthase large subunit [Paracoccus suum]AXC50195.1 acetolactate synthase large subunit [Paracoccus suum]
MNGAESLVHTLLKSGIDTCFANPGTSEMHFVAALDRIPGMHCVLGLHETVVTGMADGYARIAGKPACTLLHCGPGLANGIANLHNARRGRSGIVNIVGDQATYHRPLDAPLTADTEALARVVSAWVRTTQTPQEVGRDTAEAVRAARTHPGQVATLILPADASWGDGGEVAEPLPAAAAPPVDPAAVDGAARLLRGKGEGRTLLLLAADALLGDGPSLAYGIAAATGADVMAQFLTGNLQRGQGRWPLARVPYTVEAALEALAPYDRIIQVGATPPVSFFGYPGKPSQMFPPQAVLHVLSRPDQDGIAALRALADEVGATALPPPQSNADSAPLPTGAPHAEGLARVLAALVPEGGIICEESVSFGGGTGPAYDAAAPHTWISLTGGAIGDGFPLATGAAIGAGGQRRVISLQADGSGLYSLQALWTQARERLPCTTIVLANRRYQILLGEYAGVGANPGPTAMDMLDLGNPVIDWIALARGFGVEAARTDTLEGLADLLRASLLRDGPFLIELVI